MKTFLLIFSIFLSTQFASADPNGLSPKYNDLMTKYGFGMSYDNDWSTSKTGEIKITPPRAYQAFADGDQASICVYITTKAGIKINRKQNRVYCNSVKSKNNEFVTSGIRYSWINQENRSHSAGDAPLGPEHVTIDIELRVANSRASHRTSIPALVQKNTLIELKTWDE